MFSYIVNQWAPCVQKYNLSLFLIGKASWNDALCVQYFPQGYLKEHDNPLPQRGTRMPQRGTPLAPKGNTHCLQMGIDHIYLEILCTVSVPGQPFSSVNFKSYYVVTRSRRSKLVRGYIAKTDLSYIFGFVYAGPNYIGLCHSKQGRICSLCFPGHPTPIQWSATDCSPLWTPLFPFGATPVPHWGMPAPKGNTL